MKKTLALVLSLTLILALFAGCASDPGTGTTSAATSAATTAAATAATTAAASTAASTAPATSAAAESYFNETGYPIVDEPLTYTCMNSVTTQNSTGKWDDLAYFKAMTDLTNISFVFSNTVETDFETKMNLSLASGDLYDIYMSGVGADNVRSYGVEAGLLLPLDNYIDKYMPNLMARNAEDDRYLKVVTETDGHIYAFPQYVETATIAVATLYSRLDFTSKAGYDLDKINAMTDINEVYDLLKAVKDANTGNPDFVTLLPYSVSHLNGVVENYFFPAFGDDPYSGFYAGDDNVVTYNAGSDQMYRYLEFMNRLYTEKILYNEVYTADTATTTAITKANNAAFLSYGTMLGYDNFTSGNFDLTILPLVKSEFTDTFKCTGYAGISSSYRVISSACEKPEALIRYLDVNYSKEDVAPGLNGLSNWLGIRGENWDYTDDTQQFYTINIPDGIDLSATEYIYSYIGPSIHSYCSLMSIQKGSSPGLTCKGVESLDKLYPYHVIPFPTSFLKYTSEESSDYTTLNTEISEYVTSMKAKFISGAESLDNWSTFVSTLEKMGVKDLVSIVQGAYDRYVG